MARIQQSIEIGVPVHVVYDQLARFEDYPRFMQDVEAVHRLDDAHLHWTTKMSNRDVEWDAAITEQVPDLCIAWHNTSGPTNAGKVEVQPVGARGSRVTLTIESEPQQVPGSSAGNSEAEMAQRLGQDLARLKQLVEAGRPGSGASGAAPVPASAYAAGSEGWDGAEDPAASAPSSNAATPMPGTAGTTQSDYSLSQASDDAAEDERFSIAEEVNLDQQSDQARRVGRMPQELDTAGPAATNPSEGVAQSMRQDGENAKDGTSLKQSIERATPPSE